ncbi:MAG TPA: pyridoxamine 5'-phosphate oxidase family protein, partial [Acidimicrobiia bacterium]
AFASGNFATLGYISGDGWPHLSLRGTAQVIDEQTLAVWARHPEEGLAVAVAEQPHVTLFLPVLAQGAIYTFYGTAHISTDPAVTEAVWNDSPEREQLQDPDRKGVAVIIDLVRVTGQGRRPEVNFVMER